MSKYDSYSSRTMPGLVQKLNEAFELYGETLIGSPVYNTRSNRYEALTVAKEDTQDDPRHEHIYNG